MEAIYRIYENSVPWILDKSDKKIINRMHGTKTTRQIIEKLWEQAQK